jgi:exodeoxyribonuclease III
MAKGRRLRIASYNINGINTRLHVLTRWLEEFWPDVVGLQELKCTDEAFPAAAIDALGYSAIWHGQRSWNGVALLSRVGDPVETRRALPDDPNLEQSRYIEAAVCGILVGNLYAPNGNPWPGPKFDYKLAWLDRLKEHAQDLLDSGLPAVLIGDFNVIPTELDVYKHERWAKDALFARAGRAGLDRRHPAPPPRRTHLHLLALLAEFVRARRGHPHRPCFAQPVIGEGAEDGRSRSRAPRLGEDQRSRAHVGRSGGVSFRRRQISPRPPPPPVPSCRAASSRRRLFF